MAGGLAATLPYAAEPPLLESLSDWLHAEPKAREAALEVCLKRISTEDASIHAWVQVMPQKQTGKGTLSGIPFGVKEIIETKGLATKYGSPIYKGRIGTEDAAIVRDV